MARVGTQEMVSVGKTFAAAMVIGVTSLVAHDAQAGLFNAGDTVQAFYYNGSLSGIPEGEIPAGAGSSAPAPLTSQVNFVQGPADVSVIAVENTQIVITNESPGGAGNGFCSTGDIGTACADSFSGFEFQFTGETILGVSVDNSTPADFLPVSGTFQGNTHLGLQLISANDIRVDLTGSDPSAGQQLTLDVSFTPTQPPPLPEPGTIAVLGTALAGIGMIRRRRRQ